MSLQHIRTVPDDAMRRLMFMLFLALLFSPLPARTETVVSSPQLRAELLVHAPGGVAAGRPLWLGLQLEHQPHWHTYWKNPGDSGLPTRFEWTLPPGVVAGEIEWPAPRPLALGPLVNYGYEGTVLLPVALTLPADPGPSGLELKLRADWLVCRESCIPESGEFTITLSPGPPIDTHRARFDAAFAARPRDLPGVDARLEVEGDTLVATVAGLPAVLYARELRFVPEVEGLIEHAAPIEQSWVGPNWEARVPLSVQRSAHPERLPAVLLADGHAVRIEATVGNRGASTGRGAAAPAAAGSRPAAGNAGGIGAALLLALAGGVLLNLMPCVFPVLSLKLLGFARHAGERRLLAASGLAYTLGVVLSFVLLGAALTALRAAGEQLGWGFQLQTPGFVAALALLFTLIGLNLAGVFEFGNLMPGAATWRAQHPATDAFLTGVLAVAVASPCTAPFMGAALGFALTLPPAQTLLVFSALGVGLALPYLLASLSPALARRMPRPGPWMARLRTLMAFPMFATVVWLLWVLGHQVGVDGALGLLGVLLAVSFAAWAWAQPGRGRWWLGLPALAAVAAAATWSMPALQAPQTPAVPGNDAHWSPWSAPRVAALRHAGHPVFVDFTAAWCVTCQINKRTTLGDPAVLADFERAGVSLLRADWTSRDPAISAELDLLGRAGVPVYALYPATAGPPQLLNELLSPSEVRAALANLKRKELP